MDLAADKGQVHVQIGYRIGGKCQTEELPGQAVGPLVQCFAADGKRDAGAAAQSDNNGNGKQIAYPGNPQKDAGHAEKCAEAQ